MACLALQAQESMKADSVICLADTTIEHHTLVSGFSGRSLRTSGSFSTFEATYTDFPEEAKTAFEAALDLWENLIISRVPIRIKATWTSLSSTTLASSGATRVFKNFNGAVYKEVWYPVALAEAMTGAELNNKDFDINITLNQNIPWSYNTSGTRVAGRYDLVSIVLHEIAHGLGFTSSFKVTESGLQGQWGQSGTPYIFDMFVQQSDGVKLVNTGVYGNPSTSLKSAITGNNLFFELTQKKYIGNLPRLYSPATYREGGSVSHLDENAYPAGSPHSLMSPNIAAGEIIHDPGNFTLAMLNLMGWPMNFEDAMLITANETPGTASGVMLYPNPAGSEVNLYFPDHALSEDTFVEIADGSGKTIRAFPVNTVTNPVVRIDTDNLQTGIYLLKFRNEHLNGVTRLLKR